MKIPAFFRHLTALLVIFCLLSVSIVAAASKGDKEFKEGMKHEVAQEWDLAAEKFALAVAANPKNAEFRLHLHRALFNASQMFVQRGNALAEQKDYVGAYNAFRRAYAYDPTNQLAKAEMERMVRLQGELENGVKLPGDKSNDAVSLVQTTYRPGDVKSADYVSQKLEKVGNYKYAEGSPLKDAIKQLAEELELNVLFDKGTPWKDRTFGISLKDVSAARALDYIFKQEGLFFQKIGPKTILVADQQRRQFFTELVLRTFYLGNANPEDVAKIIQQAIPVQPGRTQTFVQIDKSTNSLTLRDTEENIRLMEKLIKSLDKDRAEVVMDVNIYEVNKRDLLKLGNQIGTADTLGNLGGFTGGLFSGVRGLNAAQDIIGAGLTNQAMGTFLSIPGAAISALQTKGDTRLIASTQVHAFNNEESMARIGQRVPVRSAQFFTGNNNNAANGVVGDVFNYEQVGLTLKFTPIVFPNQDVQVKMSIESKDVSGEQTETPTFSERSITGTARVQNNKTMLLASVAQGTVDKQRSGLPLLGLIPILGRLFSVPTNSNRQVDIVIAITPRVLRAPIILPEDVELRPTGSVVSPTSGSLEAMVYQEDREEYLASVRRANNTASLRTPASNNVVVQLPDQKPELPGYVPSSGGGMAKTVDGAETKTPVTVATGEAVSSTPENKTDVVTVSDPEVKLRPIETNVRTLDISKAFNASDDQADKPVAVKQTSLVEPAAETVPQAEFKFGAEIPEMAKGAKMILPVMVKFGAPFRVAVLALKYDEQKLAVRSVTYGEIFGAKQFKSSVIPYLNEGGKTFVSLNSISSVSESGVLAYIEIEALADGKPQISFDGEAMNILSPGGANFALNFK